MTTSGPPLYLQTTLLAFSVAHFFSFFTFLLVSIDLLPGASIVTYENDIFHNNLLNPKQP